MRITTLDGGPVGLHTDLILSLIPVDIREMDVRLLLSEEAVNDILMYHRQAGTPRTPEAAPEEIDSWKDAQRVVDGCLADYEKARAKVVFLRRDERGFDVPDDPKERYRREWAAWEGQ